MQTAKHWHQVLALLASLLLSACAQRPDQALIDQHKHPSYALPAVEQSQMAEAINVLLAEQPSKNAVHIVTGGIAAFSARTKLIQNATSSIDVQYYMLKDDLTGNAFLIALIKAAKRGVRVRLLVDDLATSGFDQQLAALSSLETAEVRVFNAFYSRGMKFSGFLGDFDRLNGRMHNKSFTVDGVVTVVGGRNIGDEYFSAREDLDFADLDAITVGPAVKQVSAAFDLYWNNVKSYPIEALYTKPIDQVAVFQALERRIGDYQLKPYIQAHRRYHEYISQRESWEHIYFCDAQLFVDHPEKREDHRDRVAWNLGQQMLLSKQSIVVSSPYFVPRDSGVESLSHLASLGVDISVITNSLAATDVAAVHSGYQRYRRALLENNIKLYEVKPDASNPTRIALVGRGASRASLHSKMFVFDEERVYVGSFNWDPRSIDLNTEMGFVFDCPLLAQEVKKGFRSQVEYKSYRLALEDEQLVWYERFENADQETKRYTSEPQSSRWRKFQAWLAGLLPIEDQL